MMNFRSKQREAEYYGMEARKLVQEVETKLKNYYGEQDYEFIYKTVMSLIALKGLMWSKSLSHKKGAYTGAKRLKEEVERWLQGI